MLLDFIVKIFCYKHTSTFFLLYGLVLSPPKNTFLYCVSLPIHNYHSFNGRRTYSFLEQNRNRLLSFSQSHCFIMQQMYEN